MIRDGDHPLPPFDRDAAAALKFRPYQAEVELPACLACGASLTGLRNDRRCANCGLAVGRSPLGNLLRYAEQTWVRDTAPTSLFTQAADAQMAAELARPAEDKKKKKGSA
jgi:hypothetical protein